MSIKLKETILSILFPPFCLSCQQWGSWLCSKCADEMDELQITQRSLGDRTYPVISFGAYHHRGWQAILKSLKFRRALCVESILREHIPAFPDWFTSDAVWTVTFIPTDPSRIRSRALEHGAWLASLISERVSGSTVQSLLARTRKTHLNNQLTTDEQRAANMTEAFRSMGTVPPRVILVDDILTSGSTMDEAVKELFNAGAQEVIGLVFASRRGEAA